MAFKRRKKKPLKKKIDLTEGSILLKLLMVAIPTLLTSLAQMAYNLTDMFWVARVEQIGIQPTEAVAAVGTAGFYPWFGIGMILIVKVGTSVYTSHAAGKNDAERVNKIVSNGLIAMMGLAFIYMLYGRYFNQHFVGLFNIDNPSIVFMSQNYLRIISTFGFFLFALNLFNGVYDGLGKTINTFYIMGAGLLFNMILDPLFILGFGWGVEGAAWATVSAQGLAFFIYVFIYTSKHRPATVNLVRYFDFKALKSIVSLGFPAGLQSMFMTSISIIIGIMVASYGDIAMSVSRIGSQIEALSWMVAAGFQVALSAFVGQNYGANQFGRIKNGFETSLRLLMPYGLMVNALLFFFAEPLFRVFISEENTLRAGVEYLRILSISQVFMILEMMTAGAFNGLGKTMIPSTVSIVGNVIRIPLAYMAVSTAGIWWALSISSIFKGVIMLLLFIGYFYFYRLKRKESFVLEN